MDRIHDFYASCLTSRMYIRFSHQTLTWDLLDFGVEFSEKSNCSVTNANITPYCVATETFSTTTETRSANSESAWTFQPTLLPS